MFRPRRAGRVVQVAFLSIWLVARAVGEAFALFLLGHGIWALSTGSPAVGQEEPLGWGVALAVGSCLVVWLSLWTLGGVMAMEEWLRLIWARHRLRVSAGGLELTRQVADRARLPQGTGMQGGVAPISTGREERGGCRNDAAVLVFAMLRLPVIT